jgi:hypothetical protein
MPDMLVPVLSYEAIGSVAEKFLAEQHSSGSIPVPIERIIDVQMGIEISPEATLQHVCDVDGFVNTKCTTIHVDVEVYYSTTQHRYREILAHELAHILLHKDVMQKLRFATMAEWKNRYQSINPEQLGIIEWQAYAFAGLVLVPPKQLKEAYSAIKGLVQTKLKMEGEAALFLTEEALGEKFGVSRDVVHRRLEADKLV